MSGTPPPNPVSRVSVCPARTTQLRTPHPHEAAANRRRSLALIVHQALAPWRNSRPNSQSEVTLAITQRPGMCHRSAMLTRECQRDGHLPDHWDTCQSRCRSIHSHRRCDCTGAGVVLHRSASRQTFRQAPERSLSWGISTNYRCRRLS